MSLIDVFPAHGLSSAAYFSNATAASASPASAAGHGWAPTPASAIPLTFLLCLLTALATGPLSRRGTKSYAQLSSVDRKTWCIGVTRGLFGVVLAALSIPAHTCGVLTGDTVTGVTPYSRLCMGVLVGFFAFELASLTWVALFYNYRNAPLWAHHGLGMLFVGSVYYTETLHFYALTSCVQELSAPLTAVSWMLARCGRARTWAFVGNHAALCAVWVAVRIGNDVHRAVHVAGDFARLLALTPAVPLVTFAMGSVMLTFFLNPLWLRMKTRQLARGVRMMLEQE